MLKEFLYEGRYSFGCIMAASGLKDKPARTVQQAKNSEGLGSIVDWALIKPVNRSVGSNDVSPIYPNSIPVRCERLLTNIRHLPRSVPVSRR